VEDVAEAIGRLIEGAGPVAKLFEFGGPQVFTYEEFLRTVAREAGLRPMLVPFPFAAWHMLARVAELLPHPPITRNQVELMEVDTVTSPGRPGLRELGIAPQPIEDTVRALARDGR
jgi:NADH dehydrogenase